MSKQELFGTTVQNVMIRMTTEFLYFILCSENPASTISRFGIYTFSTNTVSVWGLVFQILSCVAPNYRNGILTRESSFEIIIYLLMYASAE